MSDKLASLIRSRRFWLTVGGVLAVVFQDVLNIPEEEVMQVVGLLIAWVVGDSLRKTQ